MASFDEAIPPGQAGRIRASIHTENLRGDVGKSINVQTNDPANETVRLVLRARIRAGVRFLPNATLRIVPSRRQLAASGAVIVRKDPDETGVLRVEGLAASVPWIDVQAREVRAPESLGPGFPPAGPGDWVIEAELSADAPVGDFVEHAVFRTGLETEPEVKLAVVGQVTDAIRVTPPELTLAPGAGEAVLRGTVRPGLDVGALVASADGPIEAELKRTGPRQFQVVVRRRSDGAFAATGASPGRVRLVLGRHEKAVPVQVSGPAS